MPLVSVHIAVLSVGKDAAPTNTIADLATKAGHQVSARTTVGDSEQAIRAQLGSWVDDPAIDAVIVCGGFESGNASSALAPLVTETLSAIADAEAARCGSTSVFLLPASTAAVRAAMNALILPQLATGPDAEGVPVPVEKERTMGGSGLTPRAPSAPVRRSPTGANIVRKPADVYDPPTKQIDVSQLEEQIALSEAPEAKTRQVDLSRLPATPPGADIGDQTEQILDERRRPPSRLASEPIEPPAPARKSVRTEPAAVVPPPKAAPARGLLPDPPPPKQPVPLPSTGSDPVAPLPAIAPVTRTKQPTQPQQPPRTKATTGPIGVPAVIPKSPSGAVRKAPTQPPPSTGPVAVAPPPRKPPTEPPPPPAKRTPTAPPPLPETAPAVALPPPPPARSKPPTEPPPPPAKRTPTAPPPAKTDLAALVAPPLPSRPSRSELPAGTFEYADKRRGPSKLVIALIAIMMLGVGFAAVVFVLGRDTTPAAEAPPQPGVVATAIIDAAVEVAPGDAALEVEEIEMLPTPPAPATPTPAPTPTARPPRTPQGAATPSTPVTPGPVTRPDLGSAAGSAASTPTPAPTTAGSDDDTVDNAPNNPQPAAGECDEVSCVLAKYDRPCCERYRPKDSDIAPRTADGLPQTLDKTMVRAGIAQVKPRVVDCGEKSSQKGTVKITVKVSPDGAVTDTTIIATPHPVLGDCVADAMKKAVFGKSANGGSFTYPFVF